MDERIRNLYDSAVLDAAIGLFGLEPGGAEALDGFESFVYRVTQRAAPGGPAPRILKISHSLRRTLDQVLGEADFVNYLADGGLGVARAVPSLRGGLVEAIPASDGYFTAILYEVAPGTPVARADWTADFHRVMGRHLGRLHRLSRAYRPARRLRPSILEESTPLLERHLPAGQPLVRERAWELLGRLRGLPVDDQSYGLIHVDFHRGNFFVQDGAITLFDFDDCQYSWHAHDIAMALFYALPHDCRSPEQAEAGHAFLASFLAGYAQEHDPQAWWIAELPAFLKLREFELYAAIHRSFDLDDLDPWCASFMSGRRRKLEDGAPYFPLQPDRVWPPQP
jgi:Ser/Thr protein kinase RdoA (MazF antagonist)